MRKRIRNKEPSEEEDRHDDAIPKNCPKTFNLWATVCLECCHNHSRATIGVEDELKRDGGKCPILDKHQNKEEEQ